MLILWQRMARYFFAATQYSDSDSDAEEDAEDECTAWGGSTEQVTPLLQNLGFRRIGTSIYVAYSLDYSHRSHSLSIEEDAGPIVIPETDRSHPLFSINQVIIAGSDSETLHLLQSQPESFDWNMRDHMRSSLLHLLARSSAVESTRWLLSKTPSLLQTMDIRGYTPWEVFLDNNYESALFEDLMSHGHKGFSKKRLQTGEVLLGISGSGSHDMDIYKFGCECGRCWGGLLSPRTMFTIAYTADYAADCIRDVIHNPRLANETTSDTNVLLLYIPAPLRTKSNAILIKYIELFALASRRFRGQQILTNSDIWSTFPEYLAQGGSLSHFLAALLIVLSGEDMKKKLNSEAFKEKLKHAGLERCTINDGDYVRVARCLFGDKEGMESFGPFLG